MEVMKEDKFIEGKWLSFYEGRLFYEASKM